MLFYEPLFLLVFLPVVFAAFLALHRRRGGRLWVLLPASVFFYLWSEPRFVPVVLVSCVIDYVIGARLAAGRGRGLLALGICVNAAMLVFYKYTGFLVGNLDVLGLSLPVPAIALPIGVSFIVFEKITYLVDIQRGRSRPAPDFATYLLYVFLFPKLLAGPIIKYHELDAQLLAPDHTRLDDMATGFRRFMLGAVKKTLLADTLSTGADAVFAAPAASVGSGTAWWGRDPVHAADLYRFQRLFGHGDRAGADVRLPAAREFQHAVYLVLDHGVLAAVAYLAVHLDPGLSCISRWAGTGWRRGGSMPIFGFASWRPGCGMGRLGPMWSGGLITGCSWCWTGCSCCGCWSGCRRWWRMG